MFEELVKKIQLQGEWPEVDSQEHEDLMFERITTVCSRADLDELIAYLFQVKGAYFGRMCQSDMSSRTLARLCMEGQDDPHLGLPSFHQLKLEYRLVVHYGFPILSGRYDATMLQLAIQRATHHPALAAKSQFYHGTQSRQAIEKAGFTVSTSGFGQRSLRGLAVSPCELDAKRYAVCARTPAGPPEVLRVDVSLNQVIDLRGCASSYYIWHHLGFDLLRDLDAREIVQVGNQNNPFFLTDVLLAMGYDGALVDNTLQRIGPDELCIFSPNPNSASFLSYIGVEQ